MNNFTRDPKAAPQVGSERQSTGGAEVRLHPATQARISKMWETAAARAANAAHDPVVSPVVREFWSAVEGPEPNQAERLLGQLPPAGTGSTS